MRKRIDLITDSVNACGVCPGDILVLPSLGGDAMLLVVGVSKMFESKEGCHVLDIYTMGFVHQFLSADPSFAFRTFRYEHWENVNRLCEA